MTKQYISIITASYNYATFLSEAIESVIAQTYPYWELLIIDDGSTDTSLEIIKSYVQKDARIRLLQHIDHRNHGLPETVKLGLLRASYEYVAFLESDDAWTPDSLQERITLLHNTKADVIFNQCQPVGDVTTVSRDVHGYLALIHQTMSMYRAPFSLFECYLHTTNLIPTFSCVLAKRKHVLSCNFQTPHRSWLDYWLWSQLSVRSTFAYTPKKLTLWRIHPESYNTKNDRIFRTYWPSFYRAVCWNMAKKAFQDNPFELQRYIKPLVYMLRKGVTHFGQFWFSWVKPILQCVKKTI